MLCLSCFELYSRWVPLKCSKIWVILNKGVQAHSYIMGDQGRMAEKNSKPANSFLCSLSLKRVILVTSSKKQYTKSGVQRSPWSVFRKPQFFHTFSVILILSNYRKFMGKTKFSKNCSRTSLHSRFSVLGNAFLNS